MSSIFENIPIKGKKEHLVLRSLILTWRQTKHWGYRKVARKIWEDYQPDEISYKALLSLSKRTIVRGTFEDKLRIGRPRMARTIANIEQIKERHLHQERNPGQRATSVKLGTSLTTVS